MKFSAVVGQFDLKEKLIRLVNWNKLSHTLLFYGAEGYGALPLAVALAQYLNCLNKGDTDSCGVCASCIKYQVLAHPDLHFCVPVAKNAEKKKEGLTQEFLPQWREAFLNNPYLTINEWMEQADLENKQGLISAAEADNVIKKIALKNYEASVKVIIIWLPERLNIAAANKLLKSLEEPPDHTVFMLVTEAHDQILPTILSRTRLVKVPPLHDKHLETALQSVYQLDQNEIQRIVNLSNGSYAAARELLQTDNALLDFENQFLVWMRLCYKPSKDMAMLLEWIDNMANLKREGLKNFLAFSLETIRQCLLMNYASSQLIRFDEAYFAGLNKFAPYINQHNAAAISDQINTAYYHIERNANPKILFLDLSLKIYSLLKQ